MTSVPLGMASGTGQCCGPACACEGPVQATLEYSLVEGKTTLDSIETVSRGNTLTVEKSVDSA